MLFGLFLFVLEHRFPSLASLFFDSLLSLPEERPPVRPQFTVFRHGLLADHFHRRWISSVQQFVVE